MRSVALTLLCALSAASAVTLHPRQIVKRDDTVCTDLRVSANNGGRKVAIVIDSSGSMATNDRQNYRIAAGKNLNNFLISNSEASGSVKADQVTVVDFDGTSYLRYPLGDPGNAEKSFDLIDSSGDTYIASGVRMATAQINGTGTGDTDKRSAIVVFTDGSVCAQYILVSLVPH